MCKQNNISIMWEKLFSDWLKAQLISIERKNNDQIKTVIHDNVKNTQPFVILREEIKESMHTANYKSSRFNISCFKLE